MSLSRPTGICPLYVPWPLSPIPFATWNRTAWIAERTFGAVLGVAASNLAFLYALSPVRAFPVLQSGGTAARPDAPGYGIYVVCRGLACWCSLQVAAHRLASGLMHGMPSLSHTDVLPRASTALSVTAGAVTMAARSMSTRSDEQLTRLIQRMRRP